MAKHKKGDELHIGDKIKKLTVTKIIHSNKNGSLGTVVCLCDCNNICEFPYSEIKWHQRGSCGCAKRGEKHGDAYNPLYSVWREMNRRCFSENCYNYHKYGALGISVCEEWRRDCDGGHDGFINFRKWAEESGYQKGLTLDRKNQFKDYSPDNCRWSTYTVQNTHLTISVNNNSGYIGVSWSDKDKIWRARVKINGEDITVGYFHSKQEAVNARINYIKEHNLPHAIQPWIGYDGYNKENFESTIT